MNQTEAILTYLKQGNSITPLDGLRLFGTLRLGARIFELKKQGYNIEMKLVGDKKRYASYKLVTKETQICFV